MDVIGAGFGRTGTASMKAALEYLGFGPTFHMLEIMANPDKVEPWKQAAFGGQVDWKEALAGYNSTVDWPGCTFYKQLMDAFPDAKVLLTVRDPERWYTSVYNSIYQFMRDDQDDPKFQMDPEWNAKVRPTIEKMIWKDTTFHGRFEDKDFAIQVFNEHIEDVKRTVPADRLLVYTVGDGWEPLCEFLGVKVPDVDFPHSNESGHVSELFNKVRTEGEIPSSMPARE